MEYQNVQASVNFTQLILGQGMLSCLCNTPILFVSSRGTPCSRKQKNRRYCEVLKTNIFMDALRLTAQKLWHSGKWSVDIPPGDSFCLQNISTRGRAFYAVSLRASWEMFVVIQI